MGEDAEKAHDRIGDWILACMVLHNILHTIGAGESWIDLGMLDQGIEPDHDDEYYYPHAGGDSLVDCSDFRARSWRQLAMEGPRCGRLESFWYDSEALRNYRGQFGDSVGDLVGVSSSDLVGG